MSKITSWDKSVDVNGCAWDPIDESDSRLNHARLVKWPEGAPDPSTVPHAGEKMRVVGFSKVVEVVDGVPVYDAGTMSCWLLAVRNPNGCIGTRPITTLERIPDSPTIEVGGKKYRESDVVARCEELEEVF